MYFSLIFRKLLKDVHLQNKDIKKEGHGIQEPIDAAPEKEEGNSQDVGESQNPSFTTGLQDNQARLKQEMEGLGKDVPRKKNTYFQQIWEIQCKVN